MGIIDISRYFKFRQFFPKLGMEIEILLEKRTKNSKLKEIFGLDNEELVAQINNF